MKMEIFEYNIYAKKEIVAGTNDLDLAKKIAFKIAKREHCDVDIINAFTGEVHQSLACYSHITYNETQEILEKYYEVKEVEW
jgi:hypothetical protein